MLKTISAALIATSLIAAPAFAANSGTTTGTASQTQSQPTGDQTTPAPKAAKATPAKSKKLHTSARTIHHHGKKISMRKTHKLGMHKLSMRKSHVKVASKVSTKPVVHATKRS